MNMVRTWEASERYTTLKEFEAMLHAPRYYPMVNCNDWEVSDMAAFALLLELTSKMPMVCLTMWVAVQVLSPLVFHGRGDSRAVQTVRCDWTLQSGERHVSVYTFCLEKVTFPLFMGNFIQNLLNGIIFRDFRWRVEHSKDVGW